MSWINRDDLIEWLHTEEDEMREIDDRREAHEASYIRKHVREMPEMDVSQVMQELKRYCDEQPRCNDCPFWHDPCNGNPGAQGGIHAHWIKRNYDNVDGTIYKCSNCNTGMFNEWNYCPHCGAKMDEEVTTE